MMKTSPILNGSPDAVDTWVAYTRGEMTKAWVDGHFHNTVWEFTHYFTVGHLRAHQLRTRLDQAGYQTSVFRRWNTTHVYAVRRHALESRDLHGRREVFQTLLAITSQLDARYHGWESTVVERKHADVPHDDSGSN